MLDLLNEYCLPKSAKGLLLLSMPTGSGKTYNVIEFIKSHYEKFHAEGRKIIFVTNLKKNLPFRDLQCWFEDSGQLDLYNRHVLFVDSNWKTVVDKLGSLDSSIPDQFKKESYRELLSAVQLLDEARNLPRAIRTKFEAEIRTKLEPAFRTFITEFLKSEFNAKADRLEAIRTLSIYRWISELYPTVFTDERTVLFMSIDKFLVKNSTLVEPSYLIMDRLAPDAVVFIDEFDATKSNVLNNIIQSGLRHKTNLLDLFLNIRGHLMQSEWPQSLLRESIARSTQGEEREWLNIEEIIGEMKRQAEEIFAEFSLHHACKSHGKLARGKRNFLFYDYEFHHVMDARRKSIGLVSDGEHCTNWIRLFETLPKEKADRCKDICALLRKISGFLRYFQRGVSYLADNYHHLKREDDAVMDDFPYEQAVKTILNHFLLGKEYVTFLQASIMENSGRYTSGRTLRGLADEDFYVAGFRFHDIVDSDEHDTLSKIYMYDFNRTPESFLVDLCKKSMVVGISATAGLDSNVGNYDLSYLKSILGSSFVELSNDDVLRLKDSYAEMTAGYNQVTIRAGFTGCEELDASISLLEEFLDDREAAEGLYNKLCHEIADENEGFRISAFNRYVRALSAWKYYLDHPDCQAMLCLFNKQVKSGDISFDLDILREYAAMIMENYEGSDEDVEAVIVPLAGEIYDESKGKILGDLANNQRRFVLSSYQTIGAGQNLQYGIPTNANVVQINSLKSRDEMDFGGLYLDRPTNLLVNIYSEKISEDDFIKYLFQLEFMLENGALSPALFEEKIDEAFHRYVGEMYFKTSPGGGISLYETRPYTCFVNKIVMQAVGRICRSNMKSSAIHILADSWLESRLSGFRIPNSVIPVREYEQLVKAAGSNLSHSEGLVEMENKASVRSNRASAYIHRQINTRWSGESMRDWQELREQVLRYPVLNEFQDHFSKWKGAYVELPEKSKTYRYSHYGDYRRMDVIFTGQEGDFSVDESSARLKELMRIQELESFFLDNQWATKFEEATWMLSPSIFNNIYKGALGEVSGKHILESKLNLRLEELPLEEFELFDYRTSDGMYFDFKLWNESVGIEAEPEIDKIRKKIDKTGARFVFIINILGSRDQPFRPVRSSDGKIIEIPYLCQDGSLSDQALETVMEELIACRT